MQPLDAIDADQWRDDLRLSEIGERLIKKSSSFFPDRSCAVNHRGCFPRPAQVSEGLWGFWYFGGSFWYERRERPDVVSLCSRSLSLASSACSLVLNSRTNCS